MACKAAVEPPRAPAPAIGAFVAPQAAAAGLSNDNTDARAAGAPIPVAVPAIMMPANIEIDSNVGSFDSHRLRERYCGKRGRNE